jgi:hypothetical protein
MLLAIVIFGTSFSLSRQWIAFLVAVCFASGLNVYATAGTLGLLARAGLVALPPSLHLLESWYVIGVCCTLFLAEFVGDKIPLFDLLWNAAHTFVRVPAAALIAYAGTLELPPSERLLAALLGGLIALAAHGGKTAARAAIAPSPEPTSNIALSLGEDAFVIFLTWFATNHPFIAASIIVFALLVIAITIRAVWRALRNLLLDKRLP